MNNKLQDIMCTYFLNCNMVPRLDFLKEFSALKMYRSTLPTWNTQRYIIALKTWNNGYSISYNQISPDLFHQNYFMYRDRVVFSVRIRVRTLFPNCTLAPYARARLANLHSKYILVCPDKFTFRNNTTRIPYT